MIVEKLMTAGAVSVSADTTAASAARLREQNGVGALPVTARDGRLWGIVTDRDLVLRCVAGDVDAEAVTVGELMTKNPVTVGPEADVREAAALMAGEGVRRLPVMKNGRVVGMISLGDIARSRSCDTEAGLALSRISLAPADRKRY